MSPDNFLASKSKKGYERFIVFLHNSTVTAVMVEPSEYPVKDIQPNSKLLVGINYPWWEYGWDFGNPPDIYLGVDDSTDTNTKNEAYRKKRDARLEDIKKHIKECKEAEFFAIRWFILGDGFTYGTYIKAPHPDPGKNQWRFDDPPPLTQEFKDDFKTVLEVCKENELKLFPCLLDFLWCYPEEFPKDGTIKTYVRGCRADVIVDQSKYKKFFDQVLKELLTISNDYQDTIFAWDLFNEPEWAVKKHYVPENGMKEFLRYGVGIINQAGFKSSVGFAEYDTLKKWDSAGLGITLHQFHYYPKKDSDVLPEMAFDEKFPCILGEFSTTTTEDKNNYIFNWPELRDAGDQSVKARLKLIEKKKYKHTFAWSMRGKTATDWNAAKSSLQSKDEILELIDTEGNPLELPEPLKYKIISDGGNILKEGTLTEGNTISLKGIRTRSFKLEFESLDVFDTEGFDCINKLRDEPESDSNADEEFD